MFRGPHPFSRGDEEFFLGRKGELETLAARLTNSRFRLGVLEGPSGVGKTSLVLAGLSRHFAQAQEAPLLLYVDASRGLKDELSRAIDELSGPTETEQDPLARLSSLVSALQRKLILVIDHIAMVLVGEEPEWEEDRRLLSRVSQGAVSGTLPGLLLIVERHHFSQLAGLLGQSKIGMAPGMLLRVDPLSMDEVRGFVDQGALASGRYLEPGMAALIAQDVAALRPLLPIELQVLMAGIFETGRPTARRYLAAGGGRHVMADWVEEECRRAGGRQALDLLSVLADEAEEGPAWVTASRLSALTGMPQDRTMPIISSLAESGLVASWKDRCRLASHALIRLVRRVDGHLRFQRRKADRILEKRAAGRMPLLPHELPAVLPFAKTQQQRGMVKRSAMIWGGVLALSLVVLVGVFVSIQVAAVRRRSLDISDKHRPDSTLVIRKGGGRLPDWAIFPTNPPFGAMLFDTAIPASALANPLSKPKLLRAKDSSASPEWFRDLLGLLTPRRQLEFQLILNPKPDKLWHMAAKGANGTALSRLVELVAVVGRGDSAESAVLSSALAKGGSLRRRALLAALALSSRDGGHGQPPTVHAETDSTISDEVLDRIFAQMAPCRALRAAAMVCRPTRALLWNTGRMKDCGALIQEVVGQAVGSRDSILAVRGFQLLTETAGRDVSAMAIRLLEALPRASDKDRVVRLAAGLEPSLQGQRLSSLSLSALQALVREAASPQTAQAAAALLTRLGRAPVEIARSMALSKDSKDRVRAAALCRGMLSVKPGSMPAGMERLLEDADELVQGAALACLEHATNQDPGLLLRLITGRNPRAKAGAMFPFAVTKSSAPDPYKVARFLYLNAKSGPPGLAGAAARAAAHLVRRPSHWDVAKFFVFPVTRATKVADRCLAASAVLDLLDVNAASALKYVERLAADSEPKVQMAVVRAIEALPSSERRSNASGLSRILARLTQAPDSQVAQAAIWALLDPYMGQDGLHRLSDVMPRVLQRSGKPAAMMAMLWPLHQATDKSASNLEQFLVQALRSIEDPADGSVILRRLAEIGSTRAWKVIVEAASNPTMSAPAVRLACGKKQQGLNAVRRALATGHAKARREALECLLKRAGTWHAESLRKFLETLASAPGPLRSLSLAALARCPDCRDLVLQHVARLSRSALTGERVASARAAAHLGAHMEKLLERLIVDPSLEVRRAATLGLARIWSKEHSPSKLAELVRGSDTRRGMRHAAILALCLHPDRTAARKAIQSIQSPKHPVLDVLARAALANGCSRDQDGAPRLARLIDLLFLY